MKNWFGEKSHPTDEYIHWSCRGKERKEKVKELRAAYDKIKDAGLLKELEILTFASYQEARDDAAEEAAGADL